MSKQRFVQSPQGRSKVSVCWLKYTMIHREVSGKRYRAAMRSKYNEFQTTVLYLSCDDNTWLRWQFSRVHPLLSPNDLYTFHSFGRCAPDFLYWLPPTTLTLTLVRVSYFIVASLWKIQLLDTTTLAPPRSALGPSCVCVCVRACVCMLVHVCVFVQAYIQCHHGYLLWLLSEMQVLHSHLLLSSKCVSVSACVYASLVDHTKMVWDNSAIFHHPLGHKKAIQRRIWRCCSYWQ